jgi:AraC-like DNA-binding protein
VTAGSYTSAQLTTCTKRLDEAVVAARAAYFPHGLAVLGPPDEFEMSLTTRRLGSVTVGLVSYGVDVTLSCGELTGYQVNVPLSGRLQARNGDRRIVTRPGQAGIYLPTGTTTIDLITGDCLLLAIRLERRRLERELELLLSRPLRQPVRLAATLDLTRGPGRDWFELVQTVRPHAARPNDLLAQPAVADQLGAALTTGLLLAASLDYAEQVEHPGPPAGPAPIRRALEVIAQHYPEPLTITDLATASRTSVRRLQAGFRVHVGVPPMGYLRRFRLERAHEQLRHADPEATSVTEVALDCGLRHLGRFAAEYHDRYGETPSQTRQRSGARARR